MAHYIDPRCALPLYLLENEEVATNCGKIEGYVVCGVLTLIFIGVFIYFVYRNNKTNALQWNTLVLYIASFLLVLLILWLAIPALSGWMNKSSYRVYKAQSNSFIGNGFSKEQAIEKMQDLYKTNVQADAIQNGSFMIANALRFSNMGMNSNK